MVNKIIDGLIIALILSPAMLGQGWAKEHSNGRATEKSTVPKKGQSCFNAAQGTDVLKGAVVERDAKFNFIRRVQGRIIMPGARSASDAARRFINKYKHLLTNTPHSDEFIQIEDKNSLTGVYMIFKRLHAGFPVIDDRLFIHLDKDYSILRVTNEIKPIRKPVEKRGLVLVDKEQAVRTAINGVEQGAGRDLQPVATLNLLVSEEIAVVVWRVTFKTRKPAASWEVLVDAHSNRVLSKRNVALYSKE